MTYFAPDLSYLTVKDRVGGQKAYLLNAFDAIKKLDLNTTTNKTISFTYKPGELTEIKEIENVERDLDVEKPPSHQPPMLSSEICVKGNMAYVERDCSDLEIKECRGEILAYQHDRHEAYDTIRSLELWRPEKRNVVFRCSPNESPEVVEVICTEKRPETMRVISR